MKRNVTCLALAASLALAACGTKDQGAPVTVDHAWVRAMAPGQTGTAAYLRLTSDTAAKLIAVSSPAAKSVELHGSEMRDGIMSMRAVESLDLPARETVELKPGGLHLMMMAVQTPLKDGDSVSLTLSIQPQGGPPRKVEISIPVRTTRPDQP
jgi:periplasmic copper chaperone A